MNVYLYSIYDKVANVFNKPFQDLNDASAIRNFKDAVKNEPHINDYELWKIAMFDNNEAIIQTEIDKELYPMRLMSGLSISASESHVAEKQYQANKKLSEVKVS